MHISRDENEHYHIQVNESPSWGQRKVRAGQLIPGDVLVKDQEKPACYSGSTQEMDDYLEFVTSPAAEVEGIKVSRARSCPPGARLLGQTRR